MEIAFLDEFLRPSVRAKLVRLGRRYDGGYLVDERSVVAADLLLSFGINDDWSFESDFRKLNPAPICAFDATVSRRKLVKEVIKAIPRIDNPKILVEKVRTLAGYSRFFGRHARHVEAFVGLDRKPRYLSLDSVFEAYAPGDARSIFLKIDIEGWEYRILDELLAFSDRVCGMAVEFHNFDMHERAVRDFVRASRLKVCHVHCNNYEPLNERGVPLAVEVSLTRFSGAGEACVPLPHPFDMPNDRRAADYAIRFG